MPSTLYLKTRVRRKNWVAPIALRCAFGERGGNVNARQGIRAYGNGIAAG
jgi:hypothetical protein